MGSRGKPAAPHHVRRLEGLPIVKAAPGVNFGPAPVTRRPPKKLSEAAAAVWRSLYPVLQQAGAIAAGDLRILESYCVSCAQLDALGADLANDRFKPAERLAALRLFNQTTNANVVLARELGLTPLSRSRVAPAAKAGDDARKVAEPGAFRSADGDDDPPLTPQPPRRQLGRYPIAGAA